MKFTATEIAIILEALSNEIIFCNCDEHLTRCTSCTQAKELSDKIKAELEKENKE
jgi:hypothetical protein